MIRPGRWKDKDVVPTLGTVRRWLRAAEADGIAERKGVERTGKPGRPAHLWGIPEKPEPVSVPGQKAAQ